jgi:hypothetical protein
LTFIKSYGLKNQVWIQILNFLYDAQFDSGKTQVKVIPPRLDSFAQGDQMSLLYIRPKCSLTLFVKISALPEPWKK